MKAAGEASLQTGTVCMKHWWGVGMLLGTNFSHWVHLSVSTVVYDSVSPILYNPTLLFRLNFVISCHAQLETLACAKMRAVCWGKTSEKPWQKKIDIMTMILFCCCCYFYYYYDYIYISIPLPDGFLEVLCTLPISFVCQAHLSANSFVGTTGEQLRSTSSWEMQQTPNPTRLFMYNVNPGLINP